jgi:hypothetical protein
MKLRRVHVYLLSCCLENKEIEFQDARWHVPKVAEIPNMCAFGLSLLTKETGCLLHVP